MSFPNFSDPQWFYETSRPIVIGCYIVAFVLAVIGIYMGFFVTPIDYRQGNSYRIIFIHIPCAWMSLFTYLMMAFYTIWALVT